MVLVDSLHSLAQLVAGQSTSGLEVPLAIDVDDVALTGSVDMLISQGLVDSRLLPTLSGGGVAVPVGVGLAGGIVSDGEQLVVGVVGIVDAAVMGNLHDIGNVGAAVLVDGGVVTQLVSILGRGNNVAGGTETVHANVQRNSSLHVDMVNGSNGNIVLNAAVIGRNALVLFLGRRSLGRNLGVVVQVDVELGGHRRVFVGGGVGALSLGIVRNLSFISSAVVPVHATLSLLAVRNLDVMHLEGAISLFGGINAVLFAIVILAACNISGRNCSVAFGILVGVDNGTVVVHLVEGFGADAVNGSAVQHGLVIGMVGNSSIVSGLFGVFHCVSGDRSHAAGGHCHTHHSACNALVTFHWGNLLSNSGFELGHLF